MAREHEEMRFVCPTCSRQFARIDALKRHSHVHDVSRFRISSRKKACSGCARAKIKCSRDRPKCQHCHTHGVDCHYEAVARVTPLGSPSLSAQMRPVGSWSNIGTNEADSVTMGDALQTLPFWFLPEVEDVGSHFDPNGGSGINAIPGESSPWNPIHSLAEFDLRWIFDPEHLEPQPGTGLNSQQLPPGAANRPLHKTPEIVLANVANIIPLLQQEPGARPLVQAREIPRLDSLPTGLTMYFESSHLEESTRQELLEACHMPAQRGPWHDIEFTNFPQCEALECCIDLFLVHFHSVSIPSLTGVLALLDNVDRELQIHPLVHRPTFSTAQQPAVILLAIIAIGASYTGLDDGRDFADTMAEITRRVLWFKAETDPAVVQSETYLMAQLLLCHYSRGSSNEQIFNISETVRGSIIANAANAGLFQRSTTHDTPNGSLEQRWAVWIAQESRNRLAWEIFELDASVTSTFNKRPFISLFTIQIDMPCNSAFWEAETAQSWSALCPLTGSPPPGSFFPVAVNDMFEACVAERVERGAHLRHQRILVRTISRMMWQLKEMQSSFPIYQPRQPAFFEGEFRLSVNMLDRFVALNPLSGTDSLKISLDSSTSPMASQTLQAIHIAHLHISPGLVDSVYQLLKNRGTDFDKAVQFCYRHFRRQSDARRVAFHCAQVLSLCRRYPSGATCEPFNTFHAGLSLWLVAPLLHGELAPQIGFEKRSHTPQHIATSSTDLRFSQTRQLRLDVNFEVEGTNRDNQYDLLHQWLAPEDAMTDKATQLSNPIATIIPSIHGIANLSSTQGLRQILVQTADMLENMQIWGIAKKLRELVVKLLASSK